MTNKILDLIKKILNPDFLYLIRVLFEEESY